MNKETNRFFIMLMSGNEDDGKRATLAFSAACTSAAMGRETHLFLAGDGSYWGYEGQEQGVEVKGFPSLGLLMESFRELGGKVFICSACDQVCIVQGEEMSDDLVRHDWVKPRGLAAVLDLAEGGNSLTF